MRTGTFALPAIRSLCCAPSPNLSPEGEEKTARGTDFIADEKLSQAPDCRTSDLRLLSNVRIRTSGYLISRFQRDTRIHLLIRLRNLVDGAILDIILRQIMNRRFFISSSIA